VHYDDLTRLVRVHGRLATQELADRATHAALATLAERVPDGVTGALVARLPGDVAAHLRRPEVVEEESDDYVARLADLTGLDAPRAAKVARLVFRAVDHETHGMLAGRARTSLPEDVGSLVLTASRR
jgi:uncharacterized protein (DUF2267 family)